MDDTRSDDAVVARLRAFVDTIEVPTPDSLDRLAPRLIRDGDADPADDIARRRLSRRGLLAGAAAAAGLVGLTVVARPGGPGAVSPAGTPSPVSLPATLPGYRPLSPTLEFMPTGRVSMTYTCVEVQVLWRPDEPSRQVTLDEHFGGMRALATSDARKNYGSPAPAIVSDDGTVLAVGSISWQGEVVLVDARSGATRAIRVTEHPQRDVWPLEFSPDGRSVYVRDQDANLTPLWDAARRGRVVRVDVTTGDCLDAGLGADVISVSVAPDGRRLAVVRSSGRIELTDLKGHVVERLGVVRPAVARDWAHAWSPDGRLVVAFDEVEDGVSDLIVFERGAPPRRRRLPSGPWSGLAWTGPSTYLLHGSPDTGSGDTRLAVVDVETGTVVWGPGWSDAPVASRIGGVSVAAGLARGWTVHPESGR
ncbi:WD40 repeat domain-containing protein [Mobilicoccus massiliensis]|uniref:WD40 repeat domain-containing protein n=1 Tax=Mobilicoccus massiliensis TaxID=1522310 RepID=UPI00058CE24B|nr:WD40 repeat domain-containing protein [Mobilicoccus massiliensis]